MVCAPIVSALCPPFLICIDLRTKSSKVQIIHPMKDRSVDYSCFIQPVKEKLIRLLKPKLPALTSILWTPEVFIPKSNLTSDEIDNDLYLLNILENYKGNKSDCPITIYTETQVKRFSLRVCYHIITCDKNVLRDRVKKDALEWSRVPLGSRPLPYSDQQLLDYVCRSKSAQTKFDAMVSTSWMEVTRHALQTLGPRGFVMDQVIDMFGVKSTLGRSDLYLPTTVYTVHEERNPAIWGQYLKSDYIPFDGSNIQKVFIPMVNDKCHHWWACVCDLKQKVNFILDSSTDLHADPDNHTAHEILYQVSSVLFGGSSAFEPLRLMYMNPIVNLKVPQQKTCFDCGVFVLKWLDALDNESL